MSTIAAFATSGQIAEIESMIKSVLNASSSWGGAIADARRMAEVITKSRVYGTIEVIKAIAANPQHGYWSALAEYVDVDHNELLPAHLGAHGIPQIVCAPSLEEVDGIPSDPDEIDSYRNDILGLHTRLCGETVAHNALDTNNMPSPVSGRYSIVNGRLKFTGDECSVPMIRFDEARCAAFTPVPFIGTIVKLAPLWNLKEGDNLMGIAQTLVSAGRDDLMSIEKGAMSVSPVSDVMEIQKEL
jgi:hypothetical protein